MTLHAKMTMFDLQRYPWNLTLINILEDTIVYLTQKLFFFLWISQLFLTKKKVVLAEKSKMKINSLNKLKHGYLIYTWSDKAFKEGYRCKSGIGIFAGHSEIMLTVPLFNIALRAPLLKLHSASLLSYFQMGKNNIFMYWILLKASIS